MSEKHLHIIAFDIPVPVNYGGAIDIFYKIKHLYKAGIKVHLHCYEYDRKPSLLLNEMCFEVLYYKRNISKTKLFSRLPYIVATRNSDCLIENICRDDYPILFEGIHTCGIINHKKIKHKKRFVRTHNIEHEYYYNLGCVEKNMFKRYYFFNEASKLQRFEKILEYADGLIPISRNDTAYFQKIHHNVQTISAFHPHDRIISKPGKGNYALYHGSLEVGENNEAALFLVKKVFNDINIPLIIAGNKPSRELKTAVNGNSNILLKSGVTTEEIYEMISEAHVNILPTFQSTGIKLKLLAALFIGRFCLVNSPMIVNTGLESLCICKNQPDEMKAELLSLFNVEYPIGENQKREQILINNGFSNETNVLDLIRFIFT